VSPPLAARCSLNPLGPRPQAAGSSHSARCSLLVARIYHPSIPPAFTMPPTMPAVRTLPAFQPPTGAVARAERTNAFCDRAGHSNQLHHQLNQLYPHASTPLGPDVPHPFFDRYHPGPIPRWPLQMQRSPDASCAITTPPTDPGPARLGPQEHVPPPPSVTPNHSRIPETGYCTSLFLPSPVIFPNQLTAPSASPSANISFSTPPSLSAASI
jgi:hypothetical protein